MNYTATALAKKLNISRSYLYYLKDNDIFKSKCDSSGKIIWDERVYNEIYAYINLRSKNKKASKNSIKSLNDEKIVKDLYINNRRYLGNKYKLIPFIKRIVSAECNNINTVVDIFAGTGSVASAFLDKNIITNDILYSNYICHVAWFGNEKYSYDKVVGIIKHYNEIKILEENYMSKNFGNTYFSLNDCKKIGFIREDIENKYKSKEINFREKAILITSLLYAMDKIAKTCGHYDAYRKNADFDDSLELRMPKANTKQTTRNQCFNEDSNVLARKIKADLVYIDPPYNSRQYCDSYHILENVAKWERPDVFGVARKMNRDNLKSEYCTRNATMAFESLIESLDTKYILLSYNNMASKGNDRSNAKISDDDIIRILSKKGKVQIFSEEHKAFTTGKSNIINNQERLFLCKCYREEDRKLIASPLNYTGGKFQLLPQILPKFPSKISNFIDLFCGGCNVGINSNADKVIFNDSDKNLYGIIRTLRELKKEEIFNYLFRQIDHYGLSLTSLKGYDYYQSNSSLGLGKYNKTAFNQLRQDFNRMDKRGKYYYLKLFLLLIYSFNNQIRFNSNGEFNLPVGKRDFNLCMQNKLSKFIDYLHYNNYILENDDFQNILDKYVTKNTFVYADPPYLITCATYNENNGWTKHDELRLLNSLDSLNKQHVKFALSNVLECKGKSNDILKSWIKDNARFLKVFYLDKSYSNSNYQCKNKNCVTKEVLITNY